MKTIFFYLFLMSFTASFGQKQRTDLQEENLKGKVKTTITTYYNAVLRDGKIVRDGYPKYRYHSKEVVYNKDGNMLNVKEIGKDAFVQQYYFYDKKGRKIKKQESNHHGEPELASKYSYVQGKCIEKLYIIGELYCIDTFKYNAQGDPIEKRSIGVGQYRQDNDYRVSLKYDSSRRLIVTNLSEEQRITKYTYNKEGHLEKEILSEDGDWIETTLYKYISFDSQKNWTERIMYLTDDAGVSKPFFIETRKLTYYEK